MWRPMSRPTWAQVLACVIMIGHVPAVHGWEQASGMHPFTVVLRDSVSLPDNSCHPELVARTALSSDPPTSRCGDERPRSLMGVYTPRDHGC